MEVYTLTKNVLCLNIHYLLYNVMPIDNFKFSYLPIYYVHISHF